MKLIKWTYNVVYWTCSLFNDGQLYICNFYKVKLKFLSWKCRNKKLKLLKTQKCEIMKKKLSSCLHRFLTRLYLLFIFSYLNVITWMVSSKAFPHHLTYTILSVLKANQNFGKILGVPFPPRLINVHRLNKLINNNYIYFTFCLSTLVSL